MRQYLLIITIISNNKKTLTATIIVRLFIQKIGGPCFLSRFTKHFIYKLFRTSQAFKRTNKLVELIVEINPFVKLLILCTFWYRSLNKVCRREAECFCIRCKIFWTYIGHVFLMTCKIVPLFSPFLIVAFY